MLETEILRECAANIIHEKSEDKVRNEIAIAFMEIARAIEKLERKTLTMRRWCISLTAMAVGMIGSAIVISILR